MAVTQPFRTPDALDLPPGFTPITVREARDAFATAMELREKAAGTLVWARRYQLAEFAVVLEPVEPLAQARLALFPAMNALADTLAVHCPPEMSVAFGWPDTLLLDGGILGGGRIAWSEPCGENETPDWLIFGGMIRTAGHHRSEPGEWTRGVALTEQGIWDIQPSDIVENFARHLMTALHNWAEFGPPYELSRWSQLLEKPAGSQSHLDGWGDLCDTAAVSPQNKRIFAEMLLTPSWLDPKTKEPWL
jgi:hypothetical protein